MPLPPVLWVYFLGDAATDDQRPTLWIGERDKGTEIPLTERARLLIGSLAVPPGIAHGTTRNRPACRPGPQPRWSNGWGTLTAARS